MEIKDLLSQEQIDNFEKFCIAVDARKALLMSNAHKQVVEEVETEYKWFTLSEKRKAYKNVMKEYSKQVIEKGRLALNIYFHEYILNDE